MKFYQVTYPIAYAPHHLSIDEEHTLCGRDALSNLATEIFEIPDGINVEKNCGCKSCLKVYKKLIKEDKDRKQ